MMRIPYRCNHLFLDLSQVWCVEKFDADSGKKWGLRLHTYHMELSLTEEKKKFLEVRFAQRKDRDAEVDRIEAAYEEHQQHQIAHEEKLLKAQKPLAGLGAFAAHA